MNRKRNRLEDYDYSTPNAYFITVCTEGRKNLFWAKWAPDIKDREDIPLSGHGETVRRAILDIPKHYPMIAVDHFAVMPNHVHLLLQICTHDGRTVTAPSISTVMNQLKGIVTKRIGHPVWQKGFYDHVVRSDRDYREIWNYIEGNPYKWAEDELFEQK